MGKAGAEGEGRCRLRGDLGRGDEGRRRVGSSEGPDRGGRERHSQNKDPGKGVLTHSVEEDYAYNLEEHTEVAVGTDILRNSQC